MLSTTLSSEEAFKLELFGKTCTIYDFLYYSDLKVSLGCSIYSILPEFSNIDISN